MKRAASYSIARSIMTIVAFCSQFRWTVLAVSVLLTIISANYTLSHFAINTNTNDFLSEKLQWRQNLIAMDKAFPSSVSPVVPGPAWAEAQTPTLSKSAPFFLSADNKQSVMAPKD